MKSARWIISVFFTLISTFRSLEQIYNPSSSSVSCGRTDDCNVHCNGSYACKRFDFYFYNNNVNLTCEGLESCNSAEIHIMNTTSVVLNFSGESAFEAGELWANTNGNIHTVCNDIESCARSTFYYHGINSEIIHDCNDDKACFWGMVSAIPNQNKFTLNSLVPNGLKWQTVYLPNVAPSYLNLNSSGGNVYFYSLYGTTNIHPTCVATTNSCNDYTLLYTNEFHEYCELFNCSDADIATSSYSNFDILYITDTNRFDYNLSYTNYSRNGKDLMLFLTQPELIHPSLLPPLYSSSDNQFIAVCIEGSWTNGCRGRVFDLTNSIDATIVHNAKGLTIYGPKNKFKMFAHVDGAYDATYYLSETNSIMIECWGSLGCIRQNSKLYAGNNTNLTIVCGSNDCNTNSVIYSTLNPLDFYLSYLWDIQCSNVSECDLRINFTEYGYGCAYNSTYQCEQYILGTPSPTLDPTDSSQAPSKNPTISPTITSNAPTENPSTINPTETPTQNPTWFTQEPIASPTFYPSQAHVSESQPTTDYDQDGCYYDIHQEKWEGSTMEDCTYCMCDEQNDGRLSSFMCEKTAAFINAECQTDDCQTVSDHFMDSCFPSQDYTCSYIDFQETCYGEYCFECNCGGFYCGTGNSASALKLSFVVLMSTLFMFFV